MKAFLTSLVLLVGLSAKATCQSAVEIAKTAFESTVLLVMEDSSGQPLQIGSGFLVESGVVATNMHVIEGASSGYAKFIGKKKKYDLLGVVSSSGSRDLVLLRIASDLTSTLVLGDSEGVEVGQTIYAVGNPKGLEGTFSMGIVSGIRVPERDTLLQITAPISPGSSGGPVLNDESEVIGISVATFQDGQNLNFAIPVNYLKELMGQKRELAQFDPKVGRSDEALTASLGGSGIEGVVGAKFLWDAAIQLGTNKYSFSFRNNLRENVSNVLCLVVFKGDDGEPLEVDMVEYRGIVPARLAKRVESSVDGSIFSLTTKNYEQVPHTEIEFRVLRFDIEDQ